MLHAPHIAVRNVFTLCRQNCGVLIRFLFAEYLDVERNVRSLGSYHPEKGNSLEALQIARRLASDKELPGSLTKLHALASLYSSEEPALHEVLLQMRSALLATRTTAEQLTYLIESGDNCDLELQRLSRRLRRVALRLVRLLPSHMDDENVLLFLLQHRNELDTSYGLPLVRRQLKRSFGTLKEAHLFLESRYRERGFDHLLTPIATTFAQMGQSPS